MTPEQENMINDEAQEKFPIHERHEYGGDSIVTIDINKPRREAYIAGRTVCIDEMKNFVEWVDETYAMVHSDELKTSAWINCKEESVLVNGSDYHYTTLINEKGITTEKLIEIYFQTKQP